MRLDSIPSVPPLALAALMLVGPLAAQETAPLVLRLPATAQGAALGDALIGAGGIAALFVNPAQTPARGLSLGLMRFGGAATQATMASATAVGKVSVAAFAQWLDYGTNGFPTRPGALTERGPKDAQSLVGGVSAATVLVGFRIGAAAKYVEERLPVARSGGAAFDIGIGRDISRFSVGLVLQNVGPSMVLAITDGPLPTRLVVGANSRRVRLGTFFDLTASAAVSRERGGRIVPAVGTELVYEPVSGWTATLRAGLRRVDGAGRPGLEPLTFGGSVGLDRLALDYAFEGTRGGSGIHRFGFRIE